MEWYADREVTSKEREAIDEALSLFNCDLSDDDIQRWIDDDTISLNTCRNGRDVVWILLEDNNVTGKAGGAGAVIGIYCFNEKAYQ